MPGTGCPVWHDPKRPPTHDECAANTGCDWIRFFCQNCKQWEKGCAPATKPKHSARTRFLWNNYALAKELHMPISIKMGIREMPAWVARGLRQVINLVSLKRDEEARRVTRRFEEPRR